MFGAELAHGLELHAQLLVGTAHGVLEDALGRRVRTRTRSWCDGWNSRGESDDGYFADTGAPTRCAPSDSSRCVRIGWISQWRLLGHADLNPLFWHGTLLQDKRTETRTFYRRNRYYDPATGRFTQEDPIGLAGGMNLYGYAGGDPVNFSDPFGLCPPQITGRPCSGWVSAGVGLVPVIGDGIDIGGLILGRDLLTMETIAGAATVGTVVGIVFASGRIGRTAGDALGSLGPVRRLKFEGNPKHGRVDRGRASAAPINGQAALDNSVRFSANSSGRVGVDYDAGSFAVFREHTPGNFHGYTVRWNEMTDARRNALTRSGMVDRRGRIR